MNIPCCESTDTNKGIWKPKRISSVISVNSAINIFVVVRCSSATNLNPVTSALGFHGNVWKNVDICACTNVD